MFYDGEVKVADSVWVLLLWHTVNNPQNVMRTVVEQARSETTSLSCHSVQQQLLSINKDSCSFALSLCVIDSSQDVYNYPHNIGVVNNVRQDGKAGEWLGWAWASPTLARDFVRWNMYDNKQVLIEIPYKFNKITEKSQCRLLIC